MLTFTVATGIISTRFAQDLEVDRKDAKASHSIVAVGSSSVEKAKTLADSLKKNKPTPYGSYEEVYNDPNVQAVYIGTPHTVHKKNALDAIAKGKHVLCEKPFTLNAKDAQEIFDAAKAKGVFVMEAVWTRFFPLVAELKKLVHEDKIIGDVHRSFAEYAILDFDEMDPAFRLKNKDLGGGALLDVGIYTIMWTRLALDPNVGKKAAKSSWISSQILAEGVDALSAGVATYPETRAHGMWSCGLYGNESREALRIEGKLGVIHVMGKHHSCPQYFVVEFYDKSKESITVRPEKAGFGFYWEADAVANDIANGKLENEEIMPWAETLAVMEIMDTARKTSGQSYPQEQ